MSEELKREAIRKDFEEWARPKSYYLAEKLPRSRMFIEDVYYNDRTQMAWEGYLGRASRPEAESEMPIYDRLESMREAVSDFRKATYEFARGQDPDDHARMMEAQGRIFAEARRIAAPFADNAARDDARDAAKIVQGYKGGTCGTRSDKSAVISLHYQTYADADRAFEVLTEIIDAAIKASKQGGES